MTQHDTNAIELTSQEQVTHVIATTIQEALLHGGPEIKPLIMATAIVQVLRKLEYDI